MSWNRLRDRSASSTAGAVATFVLALGVLAVFASTAGAGAIRHIGGPLARTASSTGDCDNDGDNPLGVEFEECSPAPAEPGKLYTPAQKAVFAENSDDAYRQFQQTCGASFSDPLKYLQLFNLSLAAYCTALRAYEFHEFELVQDPPDASLFTIALPSVLPVSGQASRCTLRAAICRRGRHLVRAYLYAFEQDAAQLGALSTTLNRLSSTPSSPESQFGSGPGSAPSYSRRTQVAAGRAYSGLAAGWSDRLNTAEAKLVQFLDGLGGKAKHAAKKLPPVLPSAPLWATYHKMNVFELAQLFSDLLSQNIPQSRPTGQLALQLQAGLQAFYQDLYKIYVASRAGGTGRTRKLDAAARKFNHDADAFASIPGLAAYAPNAPLSARLFGFAVEGLTRSKPAPLAAP